MSKNDVKGPSKKSASSSRNVKHHHRHCPYHHFNPRSRSNHHHHENNSESLPFFPKYQTLQICQDKLLVTWFEVNFSQSCYNFDQANNGSNACTLIAVLMAFHCSSDNIQSTCPHHYISQNLIKSLGLAMLNGNEIYNNLKRQKQLPNVNLSIPEAISCAGKFAAGVREWKSVLFMQRLAKSLPANLKKYLEEWCACPHSRKYNFLFIILICDSRSILFIFDKKHGSLALVDSHQHSEYKGAAIAIVYNREDLRCLCNWFSHCLLKYHHSDPDLYELSFLYFRKK